MYSKFIEMYTLDSHTYSTSSVKVHEGYTVWAATDSLKSCPECPILGII
jgi:hypothetical protein